MQAARTSELNYVKVINEDYFIIFVRTSVDDCICHTVYTAFTEVDATFSAGDDRTYQLCTLDGAITVHDQIMIL